jgi:3-deoxy-7-phosphoheptulonate synthase
VIITLQVGADTKAVKRALVDLGLWIEESVGQGRVQLRAEPHSQVVDPALVQAIAGVDFVTTRPSSHPQVDRQPSTVQVGQHRIGAEAPVAIFAGPCSVESEDQVRRLAGFLAPFGVKFLRGGAYKPRTSPYAFQGHGEPALKWLRRAAHDHGMALCTELMGAEERDLVAEFADLIQIGSRNMHNYALLKSVAGAKRPIFLKRGMSATVEEWLGAAEYLLLHGAPSVVFCERGIRSFDTATRNLLDLGSVALLANVLKQPVVVDPSHAAGRRDLIGPLSKAALAAGAHGVMIETHESPGESLSDGPQALLPRDLEKLLLQFRTN